MGLKQYSRICPDCSRNINYKDYRMFWKARKNNSTCRPCYYKSMIGHKTSDETRRKIGEANKISLIGNIPVNKGKKMTEEQRKKLSIAHLGMKYGDETRKKHRIRTMRRLVELGIPPSEDNGAREFLEKFNKKNGYQFEPTRFMEIGYEADGYDVKKHAWIEYDPPHHHYIDGTLKPDDIRRQTEIISYFESIGNPIKEFIRVKIDKDGVVQKIETVYKGES